MQSSTYWDALLHTMHQIRAKETEAIERSARLCADTIGGGGVIHTFGTGHSALSAGETFFRAGGLACVNAILEQPFSIAAGCLFSVWAERQSGIAGLILDRYEPLPPPQPGKKPRRRNPLDDMFDLGPMSDDDDLRLA